MKKESRGVAFIAIFLSLLFVIMGLGYSHSYNPGFFPDEFAHMGYVIDVIKYNFPNYNDGHIYSSNKLNYLNHPALYYVIVGELVTLLHLQDLFAHVGRYVNMMISMIIITMTCRMIYKITRSLLATFIGGSLLLVIPMFVISGSAINNDQINVLGCTLVIYGLTGLLCIDKKNTPLTADIFLICVGGIIASLSKATGSLAIVCLFFSVTLFNSTILLKVIKKITPKQWLIIVLSILIVVIYFSYMHKVYGRFYPAPQGNPATWYFIENPYTQKLALLEFIDVFLKRNWFSLTTPYGHVIIIDSAIRVGVLNAILVALGAMSSYLIVRKILTNDSDLNATFCFAMAYIMFFIIYLFTIRQLHLNTGYLGAMQARYFFGFLPVFSLVMAKAISSLKSKAVTITIFLLMITGLAVSTYPALIKMTNPQMWQSTKVIEQPLFNTEYGPLTQGRKFEQKILAESNYISGAELKLTTFARKNQGPLTIELFNALGEVLARDVVKMETFKDNEYVWFNLSHARLIKGHIYTLRLTCNECNKDNAITWWTVKKEIELPVFLFSRFGPDRENQYSKGEAYVDGLPIGGSFTFRLYF
ncbi:hypothetical protein [Silvania hatchlandensis]|uniref:Uncharacterized protein n=1 Tax=Silvania hatchlandensis TaxID=2926469 RepID=A0A9J6Q4I4_9ENTR|nr:hypothetical protein [Silvania hatchlandensis]MCU6666600.1 hypothetical protein [Silvania hatchlandensis]